MLGLIRGLTLLAFLGTGTAHAQSNLLGFSNSSCAEILNMMYDVQGRRIARTVAGSFFSGFNMRQMLSEKTYHDLSSLDTNEALDGAILSSCARMEETRFATALLKILSDLPIRHWEEN